MLLRAYRETLAGSSEPIRRFVEEIRRDPSIPAQWHANVPGKAPGPVLPLILGQGDLELRLFTMISTFGTPHDITTDEIRVETFFPADPATERFLRNRS